MGRKYLLAAVSTMLVWGLEYYDIIIYASLAQIFSSLFFPTQSQLMSAVATWGAFATTYVVRPLGAVLFGHIGDRHGRRTATILDSALVGLAGLGIGVLPTYSTIGLAAPVMLYLLRSLQGLGIGGEAGGGAVWALEQTPEKWRPYVNGLMYSGLSWAVFLASALTLWIKELFGAMFVEIGWRFLYVIGLAPALLALLIRIGGVESPEWLERASSGKIPKIPLTAIKNYWYNLLILILINLGLTLYYYGGSGYWAYLLPKVIAPKLGLSTDEAYTFSLELSMYGAIGAVVGELLSGASVGLFGLRRSFVLPSAGLLIIAPIATYYAFAQSPAAAPLSFTMGLLFGLAAAPQTLYFAELFPVEVRWTAVSLGWNINAVVGPLGALATLFLVSVSPQSLFSLTLSGSLVGIISALAVIAGASLEPRAFKRGAP
ncbi:MFS transporter [Thermoproteus tenax]|uniref:MFS transporter n=1 Tax=Thermoproteus tenax TaxID=2271 RepID=UPI000699D170|nr:MFS transporter [Thermoproteus tenax]